MKTLGVLLFVTFSLKLGAIVSGYLTIVQGDRQLDRGSPRLMLALSSVLENDFAWVIPK